MGHGQLVSLECLLRRVGVKVVLDTDITSIEIKDGKIKLPQATAIIIRLIALSVMGTHQPCTSK